MSRIYNSKVYSNDKPFFSRITIHFREIQDFAFNSNFDGLYTVVILNAVADYRWQHLWFREVSAADNKGTSVAAADAKETQRLDVNMKHHSLHSYDTSVIGHKSEVIKVITKSHIKYCWISVNLLLISSNTIRLFYVKMHILIHTSSCFVECKVNDRIFLAMTIAGV